MPPHSSCSWRPLAGAQGPRACLSEDSSVSCVATVGPCRPLRVQGRRPPRVLYPPHLSRRPVPAREEPDPAGRWLLLLLLLLFLQIYSEEAGTPDPARLQTQLMAAWRMELQWFLYPRMERGLWVLQWFLYPRMDREVSGYIMDTAKGAAGDQWKLQTLPFLGRVA
ncbi:hypothetical protein CRUP_011961 [Coryphaenoides rupestris]|nr:hypothetical protein CRUP_011961 [Coryphaenoides rupestris]